MKILEYAIGDIHGMLDLLQSAIKAIRVHAEINDATPKFIFLGDYVDRGLHSMEVVQTIIDLQETDDAVALCGNHETMMFESIIHWGKGDSSMWLNNGGSTTIKSYGGLEGVSPDHIAWMQSLPSSHSSRSRFYVHAGVDPYLPVDDQNDGVYQWMRNSFLGHTGTFTDSVGKERYVVHGHSITFYGPDVLHNRCNLDIGSFASGMFAIGVFDPEIDGKPISIIKVDKNGVVVTLNV